MIEAGVTYKRQLKQSGEFEGGTSTIK